VTRKGSGWAHIAGESLLIIVSVLLALAADGWMKRRGDRAQETALLAALTTDFEGARADLVRVMAVHDSVLGATDHLMSVANRDDLPRADPVTLSAAVVWTLANPTFDPPTGTVETILGSGRVDILRDKSLVGESTR